MRQALRPGFEPILCRLKKPRPDRDDGAAFEMSKRQVRSGGKVNRAKADEPKSQASIAIVKPQLARVERGPQPKPIEEFPRPLFDTTDGPEEFREALAYQMRSHGETYWHLYHAVGCRMDTSRPGSRISRVRKPASMSAAMSGRLNDGGSFVPAGRLQQSAFQQA